MLPGYVPLWDYRSTYTCFRDKSGATTHAGKDKAPRGDSGTISPRLGENCYGPETECPGWAVEDTRYAVEHCRTSYLAFGNCICPMRRCQNLDETLHIAGKRGEEPIGPTMGLPIQRRWPGVWRSSLTVREGSRMNAQIGGGGCCLHRGLSGCGGRQGTWVRWTSSELQRMTLF